MWNAVVSFPQFPAISGWDWHMNPVFFLARITETPRDHLGIAGDFQIKVDIES